MEDEKLIYYDNETGLHRASASEIKTALKNVITEAYGNDVLLDDNYPDGIVINGLTAKIDEAFQTVETIYNMFDINSAEGVILDTIGNIRNEHRKPATYSDLKVRLTVTVETAPVSDLDITFVNNTLSLIDENNNYYYLTADLTITVPAGETSAYGEGDFKPTVKGVMQEPTEVRIGAIDSNLPVASENISLMILQFTSGENEESDIAFRNRMNNYSVFNSVTIKENLNNELLDLTYIKDAKIYYNNSTLNLITKGNLMSIPPAYMCVLIKSDIDFDTDTDKRQEVFDTIESYKGLGTLCWLPGDVTITIDDNDFSTAVGNVAGTYEFDYINLNGTKTWVEHSDLSTSIDLTDYGISLSGTPVEGDVLTVILTIESAIPSTEYSYETIGKRYISQSGDPTIADGISQFLVPETKMVYQIKLKYIKTANFDDTITHNPEVVIDANTFNTMVSGTPGNYVFIYSKPNNPLGSNIWKLNGNAVDLDNYGIVIDDRDESNLYLGDKLTVTLDNTGGTPTTTYVYASKSYSSVVNVKSFIKIYIDSLGIGKDLTQGNLINFLYSNTNEILPASLKILDLQGIPANLTVVDTLVNNDKIFSINLNSIELEEQS